MIRVTRSLKDAKLFGNNSFAFKRFALGHCPSEKSSERQIFKCIIGREIFQMFGSLSGPYFGGHFVGLTGSVTILNDALSLSGHTFSRRQKCFVGGLI